jgi:diguanylate cyclase (GGDEF)-like protein
MLQEILAQANGPVPVFNFHYAENLSQGVQIAGQGGIDIIVLDLSLPDSRGIQTLTEFQSKVSHIPIVILTALDSHEIEAVRKGAEDYLVKGQFDHFAFIRTVLHAIERHKIRAEQIALEKELRAANARLEKLVFLDPLTGLLNRRGLQDALSRETGRRGRGELNLLALILDLDNFAEINNTLGHAVGDIFLKEVADKLKSFVRSVDYVVRVGGDEFLILMPETRYAEGMSVAEKIRRAISKSQVSLSFEPSSKITASFGLLAVTEDIVFADELLAQLHLVLERSKQGGKDTVSYDDVEKVKLESQISEISDIIAALKNGNRFQVLKQPIYNLEENKEIGFEFLSRSLVPGLELPDDFFRVCLENNILTLVDQHCFKNCISAAAALPLEIKRHLNLFPSTMIDIPVRNLLQAFGDIERNGSYCVEISEQQIIGDPSYLLDAVTSLRKAGISIAIDDVGFGRSCLESLVILEPNVVKVDKKLVNGISKNEWCKRSLNRFLKVTEALDAQVIAEGIESQEDMNTLVNLGVRYGQGYFLGKPA